MPLGFVWVCCLFLWRSGLWTSETEPSANVIQTFFFEEGFVFHLKCLMKIPIWLCFLCCGCIYSPQQWPSAISAPLWFSRGLSSGVCCWSSFSSALLPHPKLTKPYCALSYRTVGKRWAGYLGQMLTRSSFTACVCERPGNTDSGLARLGGLSGGREQRSWILKTGGFGHESQSSKVISQVNPGTSHNLWNLTVNIFISKGS